MYVTFSYIEDLHTHNLIDLNIELNTKCKFIWDAKLLHIDDNSDDDFSYGDFVLIFFRSLSPAMACLYLYIQTYFYTLDCYQI